MNRLAARLRLTGEPLEPGPQWPPDHHGGHCPAPWSRWSDGPTALAISPVAAVEEAGYAGGQASVVVCPESGVRVIADARLDDRATLVNLLLEDGFQEGESPTDAELILGAYHRWGEDCPAHLLGDFAFVVWDLRRRRLFAARDPIGLRTLCYTREGADLLVASSVEDLLPALRKPAIHRALLADLLDRRYERWVDGTAFAGIHRLPQGYSMTASGGEISLRRFWTLGAQGCERFRRPQDYADRFGELLDQALRDRLRGTSPKALMVSGGLDSSSLACLAHRQAEAGELDGPVKLYSWTFETTPSADEREYLAAVTSQCARFPATAIVSDDCWALREIGTDGGYPLAEPETNTVRGHYTRVFRRARDEGARVAITGLGADQLLGSDGYWVAKSLLDVPWSRLWAEARHYRSALPAPLAAPLLSLGGAVGRWLPASFWDRRELRHRWGGPAKVERQWLAAPPLNGHFSRRCHAMLTHGLASAGWTHLAELSRWLGIETRQPFLDRRLVDFALNLPIEQRIQGGRNKVILRRAMRGILPESVRRRRRGAHLGDLVIRGFREEAYGRVEALFRDPLSARLGLVNRQSITAAWRSMQGNEEMANQLRQLAVFICVELWLRHHRERLGVVDSE